MQYHGDFDLTFDIFVVTPTFKINACLGYLFNSSVSHGVQHYFTRLLYMGIIDAIFFLLPFDFQTPFQYVFTKLNTQNERVLHPIQQPGAILR